MARGTQGLLPLPINLWPAETRLLLGLIAVFGWQVLPGGGNGDGEMASTAPASDQPASLAPGSVMATLATVLAGTKIRSQGLINSQRGLINSQRGLINC